MAKLTLKDISDLMRKQDICMMTTRNRDGMLESRPMSNNKDVDFNGDSYFFTLASMGAAEDIAQNPEVCLVYEGRTHLMTQKLYICLSGAAELITDRAVMEKHWVKDLEVWFKQGLDTPGITMIHVGAQHLKYWDGWDHGEVAVTPNMERLAG